MVPKNLIQSILNFYMFGLQKEYEAMKLVNLMDSMMKTGTIKPCKIGEDGKPQPIEHVLELQEGLKNQQIFNRLENDSD